MIGARSGETGPPIGDGAPDAPRGPGDRGGLAAYLHISERDPLAARMTRDIGLAVRRADLERIREAVRPLGLELRHAAGGPLNETGLALLRCEVRRLRQWHRAQQFLLLIALAAVAGLAINILGHPNTAAAQSTPDKGGILHVRGLVVEDQSGHERLRLGAPLPDPMVRGVRRKRSGAVSGLLISDANGNERGGFVTADATGEAFLGLDSEDEQKVLLLANPKGGEDLILTNNDGNSVQVTVFPEGPKLTMRKTKQIVLELPAIPK